MSDLGYRMQDKLNSIFDKNYRKQKESNSSKDGYKGFDASWTPEMQKQQDLQNLLIKKKMGTLSPMDEAKLATMGGGM